MTRGSKPSVSEADARAREILASRTAALAARGRQADETTDIQVVLACEAAGSLYGLPLREIARVEGFVRCGAAPAAHPAFLGLASAAGRVLPVLDFAGLVSAVASADPGGYLIVPRDERAPALRVLQRPSAVEVQPLEDDAASASVVSGDERQGRLLRLLLIQDLLAQTTAAAALGA